MRDIRGNVDTRLRKLDEGQFDAIVLARAGLSRLGLADRITEPIALELMLPAVGQGALGIEARSDDSATRSARESLDHLATHRAVIAERALLARLLGGCLAPVGAYCRPLADGSLELIAVVISHDGRQRILASQSCRPTGLKRSASA